MDGHGEGPRVKSVTTHLRGSKRRRRLEDPLPSIRNIGNTRGGQFGTNTQGWSKHSTPSPSHTPDASHQPHEPTTSHKELDKPSGEPSRDHSGNKSITSAGPQTSGNVSTPIGLPSATARSTSSNAFSAIALGALGRGAKWESAALVERATANVGHWPLPGPRTSRTWD